MLTCGVRKTDLQEKRAQFFAQFSEKAQNKISISQHDLDAPNQLHLAYLLLIFHHYPLVDFISASLLPLIFSPQMPICTVLGRAMSLSFNSPLSRLSLRSLLDTQSKKGTRSFHTTLFNLINLLLLLDIFLFMYISPCLPLKYKLHENRSQMFHLEECTLSKMCSLNICQMDK